MVCYFVLSFHTLEAHKYYLNYLFSKNPQSRTESSEQLNRLAATVGTSMKKDSHNNAKGEVPERAFLFSHLIFIHIFYRCIIFILCNCRLISIDAHVDDAVIHRGAYKIRNFKNEGESSTTFGML